MKREKSLILFLILFVLSFIFLSFGILNFLDLKISQAIPNLWAPFFNSFFIFISQYLFDTKVLCFVSVVIFLFLFRKNKVDSLFFISTVGITAVLSESLKFVFKNSRPLVSLIIENSNSFPSSHSSVSLAFFLSIFLCFNKKVKNKNLFLILSFVLIGLIGFSRIYLNVHYLSDVLAGYFLGGIVLISSLLFKKFLINYFKIR